MKRNRFTVDQTIRKLREAEGAAFFKIVRLDFRSPEY
jgi:hypothetical protein